MESFLHFQAFLSKYLFYNMFLLFNKEKVKNLFLTEMQLSKSRE